MLNSSEMLVYDKEAYENKAYATERRFYWKDLGYTGEKLEQLVQDDLDFVY